ncbi:tRNA uridine-5-carboxymethylaminomethyl(34) synthesis GTPase MnmE [Cognatishimia sp. F0-27]|uniref:tRNA uridine-5-carboxymethylaminomethyl(34) synthesis GTPase MnmE n=1 Tax=Cognatishimia sp. F0-27 TaxID=2816855 RepID=UPI001D0CADBC|nr:tRNA uridine-5-carboxymethylaminomethyl(34) synthesis GTPase MnmE [Cognatishimia sp. F0-27]MCC1492452.1 tRNA uridine-5-carboxymethylaminomethyl(34) synthesis GTPase MnmE [Cognatishimia sp. F0-27]
METIYALASASGKAGVAVVRVSGSAVDTVCLRMAGRLPQPRLATVCRIQDLEGGYLDEALVLRFLEGASFTGESVVEFHLHGSLAVVSAVLRTLGCFDGLRLAEPGEFTRRALENGRMELTQVEGLSDLIEAETEAQRVQALRQLSGALGQKTAEWRTQLVQAASLLEATIDFADEEVPVDVTPDVERLLQAVDTSIRGELRGLEAAERVRSGFVVAIVGAPNAGKSTLLNMLAGRDAAITSEIAGTTRDVIEVRLDIAGLAVTLLDTAGLRETTDPLEVAGISRARVRAAEADLRIHLDVAGQAVDDLLQENDICLVSKDDDGVFENGVSAKTGWGIDRLILLLEKRLKDVPASAGLVNRQRHREALERGLDHLGSAIALVSEGSDMYDLASEELRAAIHGLQRLVGQVDVEDLLGEIFANFCIGK